MDLVTFIEQMLNGKLHFLRSDSVKMKTNQMFTIKDSLNYLNIFYWDHGSIHKIGITSNNNKKWEKNTDFNTGFSKQVQSKEYWISYGHHMGPVSIWGLNTGIYEQQLSHFAIRATHVNLLT